LISFDSPLKTGEYWLSDAHTVNQRSPLENKQTVVVMDAILSIVVPAVATGGTAATGAVIGRKLKNKQYTMSNRDANRKLRKKLKGPVRRQREKERLRKLADARRTHNATHEELVALAAATNREISGSFTNNVSEISVAVTTRSASHSADGSVDTSRSSLGPRGLTADGTESRKNSLLRGDTELKGAFKTGNAFSCDVTGEFYFFKASWRDATRVALTFLIPTAVVLLPLMLPFEDFRRGPYVNWLFTGPYSVVVASLIFAFYASVYRTLVTPAWGVRELAQCVGACVATYMCVLWICCALEIFPVPFSPVTITAAALVLLFSAAHYLTPLQERELPIHKYRVKATAVILILVRVSSFSTSGTVPHSPRRRGGSRWRLRPCTPFSKSFSEAASTGSLTSASTTTT
jgi:chromate transport protein ChrA